MPRYVLDFGSSNGSLTPPTFGWFRDSASHLALPAPQVFQSGGSAWTYYFDYVFPAPGGSASTSQVDYGLTLAGVGLSGVLLQPGLQQSRFFLDFGRTHGQLSPPTFTFWRDEVTGANLTPPAVFASSSPAWTYYFDASFPVGTTAIAYGLTLSGVSLSGTLSAPVATQGVGGQQTLLELRELIRQESDTENDPHISDPELNGWINQSRLRLYAKLVTSFGDDYFTAQAQFTTDGINTQFQLPDGKAYGGAPPHFKGQLLEAVAGGNISPNAPVTLQPFNLREKNRYSRPFSILAVPGMFPRYRIMGSNPGFVVFTPLPSAGLVCNLWYAPKLAPLVNDYDVADDFSGWLELVVLDCAIKAVVKQERDPSALMGKKRELLAELDAEVANRNLGDPNTVIEADTTTLGPFGLTGMGPWGGSWY